MQPLTDQERKLIREWLLERFPWLLTDESVSGADTVEQLIYAYLEVER